MELLINVDVDDSDRAVAFYRDGLGFRLGRRFDDAFVELVGGSAPVYLLGKAAGSRPHPGAREGRDYGRHWTPVHFDLVVDELTTAAARAVAAGATQEGDVRDEPYGRLAFFADPFGNGFCLLEWRGRGYDELLGGGR